LEFLDADYTFVNEALAKHYGMSGIQGEEMRRVTLDGTQRGGLVTHASILMLMSPTGVVSPVQRGKWVMENLLASPPLAPPSGLLAAFDESRKNFGPGTVRQLLEKHRSNPSCASCHAKLDALGIALENFDHQGAWRTRALGRPVDAVGTLPGGQTINGHVQLKAYLLGNQDLFIRSLSGKLLSYTLGRKLEQPELSSLDSIPKKVAESQHRFSSVLLEVVQTRLFQEAVSKE
jgi:hypothetical protein